MTREQLIELLDMYIDRVQELEEELKCSDSRVDYYFYKDLYNDE